MIQNEKNQNEKSLKITFEDKEYQQKNRSAILVTACVIAIMFFATFSVITILSYASHVQQEFRGQNSLYISCPDYMKDCSCSVYGDDKYMVDTCVKYMERD